MCNLIQKIIFLQVDASVYPLFNAITAYATVINATLKFSNVDIRSGSNITELFFNLWFPGILIMHLSI